MSDIGLYSNREVFDVDCEEEERYLVMGPGNSNGGRMMKSEDDDDDKDKDDDTSFDHNYVKMGMFTNFDDAILQMSEEDLKIISTLRPPRKIYTMSNTQGRYKIPRPVGVEGPKPDIVEGHYKIPKTPRPLISRHPQSSMITIQSTRPPQPTSLSPTCSHSNSSTSTAPLLRNREDDDDDDDNDYMYSEITPTLPPPPPPSPSPPPPPSTPPLTRLGMIRTWQFSRH